MELSELKEALLALRNRKPGLKGVEQQLGMPQNALAGMLSGKRKFPKRWVVPLTKYVEALKKTEERAVPENKEPLVEEPETGQPYILSPEYPRLTEAEIIEVAQKAHKSPPPGLDKSQRLRWLREHNQELR